MTQQTRHTDFLTLLERHKGLVYQIARSYVQDEIALQDLVQEISLQLWRAFPRYDPKYAETTWLYRIALNVSISFLRKESRRRKHQVDSNEQLLAHVPADSPVTGPDVEWLELFMGQLSPWDKALLILYLEGHSQAEMGEIMGISPSNAGTRLHRLKGKLKQFVEAGQAAEAQSSSSTNNA